MVRCLAEYIYTNQLPTYPFVYQPWRTASWHHRILAAPSGGQSWKSPGWSSRRRSRRRQRRSRRRCWGWSKWATGGGKCAGCRGCWEERDRRRQRAARRRRLAPKTPWPCRWAWPEWVRTGCGGSPGTSSDHSVSERKHVHGESRRCPEHWSSGVIVMWLYNHTFSRQERLLPWVTLSAN